MQVERPERPDLGRPRQDSLRHVSLKYGFADDIRPVTACPQAAAMNRIIR